MSDADYTPDSFVSALIAERASLQQSLDITQQNLQFATKQWPRTKHNVSLYQDPGGQVWTKDRDGFYLFMVRGTHSPIASYEVSRDQPKDQPTEVKSSRDHFQEEWTWEAIPEHDGRTWSTIEGLTHEAWRYQRCLDLVNALLGKQNQVKVWIHDTATQQGEARRNQSHPDWRQLVDKFHPEFYQVKYAPKVDFGQVSSKLSAIMDQVALGEQVRDYGF